jgi:DNA-binding response OmpR family regulator
MLSAPPIFPPAPPTTARLLVVEDNDDLAFGLHRTLTGNGYRVEVARDGADAMRRARVFKPHLIILDLMMPGMDGFTVLHGLRSEQIDVPVLILSARSEEHDKLRGFRAGADDFVTKPFGVLELLARVAALLRRAAPAQAERQPAEDHAEPIVVGALRIDLRGRRVYRNDATVSLAPKEFDLLVALVQKRGSALSRTTLLREVWGHAPDVQTRTVDIHVAELRRKLEAEPSRPRHIVTVWKTGYRFDP